MWLLRDNPGSDTLHDPNNRNSLEILSMPFESVSRILDRSASRTVLHAVCIVTGGVLGILYLLMAFVSASFGELALPAIMAFTEAFAKGSLFVLLGYGGIQAARRENTARVLLRFAAAALAASFAGFAILTGILSLLFDSWTVSYMRQQGTLAAILLFLLTAGLLFVLKQPERARVAG